MTRKAPLFFILLSLLICGAAACSSNKEDDQLPPLCRTEKVKYHIIEYVRPNSISSAKDQTVPLIGPGIHYVIWMDGEKIAWNAKPASAAEQKQQESFKQLAAEHGENDPPEYTRAFTGMPDHQLSVAIGVKQVKAYKTNSDGTQTDISDKVTLTMLDAERHVKAPQYTQEIFYFKKKLAALSAQDYFWLMSFFYLGDLQPFKDETLIIEITLENGEKHRQTFVVS